MYIETHGGTAIGGSDDHAGIDIGRTFTETPRAADPQEFLAHIRAGRASAHGQQGSAAKWAHAAMALAIRSLSGDGDGVATARRPAPRSGVGPEDRRAGDDARATPGTGPAAPTSRHGDALALLRAWLLAMDLDVDEHKLLTQLQEGELGHADLDRRARRVHERKLAAVVHDTVTGLEQGRLDGGASALALFDACIPAIPYAAASAFLGREKAKLARSEGDRPRVALVADAIGSMHGVTHTIQQIRTHGVRGFDVEVIGTDADVDRRLSAVAEIDVPFYPGLEIGVPTVPAIVDALAEGRYDIVHVCSPGPAGYRRLAAGAGARAARGSAATTPSSPPMPRCVPGRPSSRCSATSGSACSTAPATSCSRRAGRATSGSTSLVSPTSESGAGIVASTSTASIPATATTTCCPARSTSSTRDASARRRESTSSRTRSSKPAAATRACTCRWRGEAPRRSCSAPGSASTPTFLGWLSGEDLARAYASADVFLFASSTETFGQVVLEAQASGLPVVAVDRGGPACLIEHGETGLLAAPDVNALADAVVSVTSTPLLSERISRGALAAVRGRSWEAALDRLAAAYRIALAAHDDRQLARGVA